MRIVSLVPSLTELVCALGLANHLVGRTGFCVHPRETVRRIPKVGGTKTVKLEAVRALEPTHVVLNRDENRRETAEALAEFVPHLVITHPRGPLDNLALYRQFGEVFDCASRSEALCTRFEEAYAVAQRQAYDARKALYLVWKGPWMTVSRDTYISRTLALFGLHTVPKESVDRYPKLGGIDVPEADLVLLSSEPYRFRERHRHEIQSLTGRPTFLVDGEMTSWYGPRAITGLEYLTRFATRLRSVV